MNGNKIIKQKRVEDNIIFYYALDELVGFTYNKGTTSKEYLYRRNIQGDIVGIYNEEGTLVGEYAYDGFGNHKITVDVEGIATINPFRYRGYFYDEETGFYYLNSRYYDPKVGRFISADDISYLDPESMSGLNLYAYCGNNPIMRVDPNGNAWWHWAISGVLVTAGIIMVVTGVGGILGGALITAGVNSLVSGYANEMNGGSFTAGWIGGGLAGFLSGLTAGIGGNLLVSASNAVNFSMIGQLLGGIVTSFAGGFSGTVIGSMVTSHIDGTGLNWSNTLGNALITGTLNVVASIGAGLSKIIFQSGNTNIYRALGVATSLLTEFIVDLIAYGINKAQQWWGKNKSTMLDWISRINIIQK